MTVPRRSRRHLIGCRWDQFFDHIDILLEALIEHTAPIPQATDVVKVVCLSLGKKDVAWMKNDFYVIWWEDWEVGRLGSVHRNIDIKYMMI